MIDQLESRASEIFNSTVFDLGAHRGIIAATGSFIDKIYGSDHMYYLELIEPVRPNSKYPDYHYETSRVQEILRSLKREAESGLLLSNLRDLVSAELFSNHLDMAEHLLDNDYKDSAVVIIGSTLEIYLRDLAESNSIDIMSDGRYKGVKQLNKELSRKGVYNKLKSDQINYWWDMRNASAHGDYDEYDSKDVRQMLAGVRDFIADSD